MVKMMATNVSVYLKGRLEIRKQISMTWLLAKDLDFYKINVQEVCRQALISAVLQKKPLNENIIFDLPIGGANSGKN